MLIAGGYERLSEPARSAAVYAQWRHAKTMTLAVKSLIILLLQERVMNYHRMILF